METGVDQVRAKIVISDLSTFFRKSDFLMNFNISQMFFLVGYTRVIGYLNGDEDGLGFHL